MPRGFLVKRSKRSAANSYRIREQDDESPSSEPASLYDSSTHLQPDRSPPPPPPPPPPSHASPARLSASATRHDAGPSPSSPSPPPPRPQTPTPERERPVQFGTPDSGYSSYSPVRPVSAGEQDKQFFGRSFHMQGSPVAADSFHPHPPPPPPPPLLSISSSSSSSSSLQQLPRLERVFHSVAAPPIAVKLALLGDVQPPLSAPLSAPPPPTAAAAVASKRAGGKSAAAERGDKPPPKKYKTSKKLSFKEEVLTSPVLGLRIKEEPVEPKPRQVVDGARPMAEFICQLCKEEYLDPLSLAQHKCSRIIKVEYRCPECDKVFSCPANLASHRRWHKPRSAAAASAGTDAGQHKARAVDESKATGEHHQQQQQQQQQQGCEGETQHEQRSVPSNAVPDEGQFECDQCSKRFRRKASLQKHLAVHQPVQHLGERAFVESTQQQQQQHYPQQQQQQQHTRPWLLQQQQQHHHHPAPDASATALRFMEARETALQASGGDPYLIGERIAAKAAAVERLIRLQGAATEVFLCKFCALTFYSSPGLTRHINKCHPSENRQVILLQMPVRPTC